MLSIRTQQDPKQIVPNILPCTIKHNGPVSAAERYWSPTTEADETSTAYFRGRKLQGRTVALPAGYQGAVLQKTDKLVQEQPSERVPIPTDENEDLTEETAAPKQIETRIMEQQSVFERIMVWGHEAVPEDDDVYVKGMQEWIGFAQAVSCENSKGRIEQD